MVVYWLHRKTHKNILTEGYVGITINPERREKEYRRVSGTGLHNIHLTRALEKYDDIVFEVIFDGTRDECINEEIRLRPEKNIGWNIAMGGFFPPDVTGIKRSEKTRQLMSENNVGFSGRKHTTKTKEMMSLSHKGQLPHNAKPVHTPFGIFKSTGRAGKYIGVSGYIIRKRIFSDSEEFNQYYYIQETHT